MTQMQRSTVEYDCSSPKVEFDCSSPKVDEFAAHSQLWKLLWLAVAAVGVIVGLTYLEPWAQKYEVKTATTAMCSELVRSRKIGPVTDPVLSTWMSKIRAAGVHLARPQDATAELSNNGRSSYFCDVKVSYDTVTPWKFVDIIYPSLKPLQLHHIVRLHKEMNTF